MKTLSNIIAAIAAISLILSVALFSEKKIELAVFFLVICIISSAIVGKIDAKILKSLQDKSSSNNKNYLIKMENGNENQTTEKDLTVIGSQDLQDKVKDVQIFGNPDAWKLICKASSQEQGWMKSTKAMELKSGVVMQVTTQQKNQDGSWAIAEAITFLPSVKIGKDKDGNYILQ